MCHSCCLLVWKIHFHVPFTHANTCLSHKYVFPSLCPNLQQVDLFLCVTVPAHVTWEGFCLLLQVKSSCSFLLKHTQQTSCSDTSNVNINVNVFPNIFSQAAETRNKELEGRIEGLQLDINDSRQKQGNMKIELKKLMNVLDGKLDELQEFRQGLSKLGADNWGKVALS